MQLITLQNFHIQTWFSQFLWFFSLKCYFKGQMIPRIHLILPNAYKLMCFDRNINGNRDVKFLECDKWSLHWYKNLTLVGQTFVLLTYACNRIVSLSLSFRLMSIDAKMPNSLLRCQNSLQRHQTACKDVKQLVRTPNSLIFTVNYTLLVYTFLGKIKEN